MGVAVGGLGGRSRETGWKTKEGGQTRGEKNDAKGGRGVVSVREKGWRRVAKGLVGVALAAGEDGTS